ncbi:S1C family serine protease [Peribacillus huizhouensis]|uniref:Serine protease n=1 Tax=Peribacillus huizhouensis TaxID=1501239 RepID=A0ABR6CM41_9BACI|nr:S1C family serine protease [Peribacillus huizhouensis]MBA9025635.1 hypothetical protein [Peribacillus huizhouensis]
MKTVTEPVKQVMEEQAKPVVLPAKKTEAQVESKKDITDVIAEQQTKVYTIYTESAQGSGFLMNHKGDIVTNAHVVEGYVQAIVKNSDGSEYGGQVIGYSNNTDIAIIRVPELAGKEPMALETSNQTLIGEEVIALGSPHGLENTATIGYITGVGRNFYIGNRSYENIYQMSAAISPGSSGGPLLSKKSGKTIAINSAKMIGEEAIGFSIPVKDVYSILQDWVEQPLTEQEIFDLFYNEYGEYYYQDLWEDEEYWYFDGGEYSEEEPDTYVENPSDEEIDSSYTQDAFDDDSYYQRTDDSIGYEELEDNQTYEEYVEPVDTEDFLEDEEPIENEDPALYQAPFPNDENIEGNGLNGEGE